MVLDSDTKGSASGFNRLAIIEHVVTTMTRVSNAHQNGLASKHPERLSTRRTTPNAKTLTVLELVATHHAVI